MAAAISGHVEAFAGPGGCGVRLKRWPGVVVWEAKDRYAEAVLADCLKTRPRGRAAGW